MAARGSAELQPADPAILYLTSGATGEPKMVLVTHQALVSNLDMAPAVLAARSGGSHRGVSAVGAHRAAGGDGAAADPRRHARDVLREPAEAAGEIRKVRPTILLAPPRMWERIYSTICTELRKRPGGGAQGFLRWTGAGAGGGPLSPARQAGAVRAFAFRSSWPTGCCFTKCACGLAAGFA